MTTLAQIQQAMGPVYLAWAKPATEHHYTQPAFSSEWVGEAQAQIKPNATKPALMAEQVRNRLKQGPARRDELFEMLGCVQHQWKRMIEANRGEFKMENIGYKKGKYTLVWLDCAPPKITQRSQTYQVLHFFKGKGWINTSDVVGNALPPDARANYLPMLEARGLLEVRLLAGVKQYREKV